jgi:AraC-like DNA-binding protein
MKKTAEGESRMIHAWYEKTRDQKDSIYFALHRNWTLYSKGSALPGFHNSVELCLCAAGCMDIAVDGRLYSLEEGDLCFINSREPHRYYYNGSARCYVVVISQSFFNGVNRWGEISFPTHSKRCEGYGELLKYLEYALAHWDPDSLLCKSAFADTLAYLMMRYYPVLPKREREQQSENLLCAMAYICEHCTDRLRVGEVASRFGYSANYFSTTFNAFMGMSFSDYLNACRIIEYLRLRKQFPEMSTQRAAEECGFGSMNSFYRAQEKFEREEKKHSENFTKN